MDSKILLENGTNELMILEFTLGDNCYGINVAKIREITKYVPVTPIPNSHPSIEGVFMPRDVMITAIDLKNCLGRGQSEPKGLFIITNFNKLDIAFHVDNVLGIHTVSWSEIIKPEVTISAAEEGVAIGIVNVYRSVNYGYPYVVGYNIVDTAEIHLLDIPEIPPRVNRLISGLAADWHI